MQPKTKIKIIAAQMCGFILEKCPVVKMFCDCYNHNMRKIKIFVTVFILYEFVILTVLQIHKFCIGIFNNNFCTMGGFQYFLVCVMLPVLISLFFWWMPDIGRLFCPNKCNVQPEPSIKDVFNEVISKQDIEKFITAAIIMGIQKFATIHPKTTQFFDNILKALKNTNVKIKKQRKLP